MTPNVQPLVGQLVSFSVGQSVGRSVFVSSFYSSSFDLHFFKYLWCINFPPIEGCNNSWREIGSKQQKRLQDAIATYSKKQIVFKCFSLFKNEQAIVKKIYPRARIYKRKKSKSLKLFSRSIAWSRPFYLTFFHQSYFFLGRLHDFFLFSWILQDRKRVFFLFSFKSFFYIFPPLSSLS